MSPGKRRAQRDSCGTVYARRGNVLQDAALRETIRDGYDVVVANIVADVVIAMCPLFGGVFEGERNAHHFGHYHGTIGRRKGGCFMAGFVIKKISEKGEWAAITAAWK